MPSVTDIMESTQTFWPVMHEYVPTWHALSEGVQVPPSVQGTQTPALQTSLTPQTLPSSTLEVLATQTWTPVEQENEPTWQGSPAGVHMPPAVQAVQAPALQTSFGPHIVPFCTAPWVSIQTGAPVPQS